MNKMPIITSFVSLNTPYEKVAQNFLIPSLKHFNLSYDIEYFENKGSWIENIQYKPQFCKKLLLKHKFYARRCKNRPNIGKNRTL